MFRKYCWEFGLLLLQMLGLGFLVVPRHTSTYWEPEFTGWVVPLANRLNLDQPLYSDGAHSPLPPLSYVLVYLLTGGKGVWWHESLLNYLCQCLALIVMFTAISQLAGRLVAYLACSISLVLFLALAKSILYDSMAQLMVALAIFFVIRMVVYQQRKWSFALGAILALLLLTKQSTALGAIGGALLILLRRSSRGEWWAFIAGAALTATTGLLAMAPWISLTGFVQDTLLLGSEPKGGARSALLRLGFFGLQFLGHGAVGLVLGMALVCCLGQPGGRTPGCVCSDPGMRRALLTWPLVLAVALGGLFTFWFYGLPSITVFLMWPALVFYLVMVGVKGDSADRAAATIALAATVGHCLSVHEFRFFYDNNPLIVLVMAFLIEQFFRSPADWFHWRWWGVPVIPVTPIVVLLVGAWLHAAPRFFELGQAKLTVGDIPHLDGARLPERVDALLLMVREVRRQTSAGDRVLMLPEDPNLFSWFDRPRPNLTSSVLFIDTYWDRLVEDDLARLQADPPEVIILGPQQTWPDFARLIKLRPEVAGDGVPRLIAEIEASLLSRYEEPRDYTVRKLSRGDSVTPKNTDNFRVYYLRK